LRRPRRAGFVLRYRCRSKISCVSRQGCPIFFSLFSPFAYALSRRRGNILQLNAALSYDSICRFRTRRFSLRAENGAFRAARGKVIENRGDYRYLPVLPANSSLTLSPIKVQRTPLRGHQFIKRGETRNEGKGSPGVCLSFIRR